jgi:hypothetical protein
MISLAMANVDPPLLIRPVVPPDRGLTFAGSRGDVRPCRSPFRRGTMAAEASKDQR